MKTNGGNPIYVEDLLIWAYQVEKIEQLIERGATLHVIERQAAGIPVYGVSADGCCQVETNWLLGTRVDRSGQACTPVAEEAELVYDSVKALPRSMQFQLAMFGKSGLEPEWRSAFRVRVGYRKSARASRVDFGYHDSLYDRHPKAVVVSVMDDRRRIDGAKQHYLEWRAALEALQELLGPVVGRWNIVGIKALSDPWTDEEKKYSKLIESLLDESCISV